MTERIPKPIPWGAPQVGEAESRLVQEVLASNYLNEGQMAERFEKRIAEMLGARNAIAVTSGTAALFLSLKALDIGPGDEVIVPAFTYVATAEVIALLGLTPVMVDVDPDTFNTTADLVGPAITPRTKAIVPVHLFGQSADMEPLMELARRHNLYVIEDNAQAIGSDYMFADGRRQKSGTIGHIGCTSFFPSKNLGCYGDGGAMMTNDAELAQMLRVVANHGQSRLYHHTMVGVNSRLDSIQAAILSVKLKRLDAYSAARQRAAAYYDAAFSQMPQLKIPVRQPNSTHVFHQYTLVLREGDRDALRAHLSDLGIPAMIYYPIPLYEQEAFQHYWAGGKLPVTDQLCRSVFSLPMHTELTPAIQDQIIAGVASFFKK